MGRRSRGLSFPGNLLKSYPIYSKFEADGSGVISALTYSERLNKFNLNIENCSTQPTSMAVDFSRKSGADLLIAMVGPMVGYEVQYWMDIKPTKINDVTGADGYATRTTQVTLGGKAAYVMTLQKGDPPKVTQKGHDVVIGGTNAGFRWAENRDDKVEQLASGDFCSAPELISGRWAMHWPLSLVALHWCSPLCSLLPAFYCKSLRHIHAVLASSNGSPWPSLAMLRPCSWSTCPGLQR